MRKGLRHLLSPIALLSLQVAAKSQRIGDDLVRNISLPVGALGHGSFTLNHFQKILSTELTTELGVQRLPFNESNYLWKSTMEYEWSLAEERENNPNHHRGRRIVQDSSRALDGTAPFVICDMNYGKSGEDCRSTIEAIFGSFLLVSYTFLRQRMPVNFLP
jgi:hypothetical protein